MSLVLDRVSRSAAGVTHVDGVSLALERRSLNVLLGPTLAGKTSRMRLMAGLDVPTSGRVFFDERDGVVAVNLHSAQAVAKRRPAPAGGPPEPADRQPQIQPNVQMRQ